MLLCPVEKELTLNGKKIAQVLAPYSFPVIKIKMD